MSIRYLTKSRFKVGSECPTKLRYLDDKAYGSTKADNAFLTALAEGGFQVGELAELYHPGGVEIVERDKDKAVAQTLELLKRDRVVIYEAALRTEQLYIKADLVIKTGSSVEIVEVKAKSFDPSEENAFFTKGSVKKSVPKLSSEWEPYVLDIAFQTFVLKRACPQFKVSSFLMLADKTATATVDGINQNFFLEKSAEGRSSVKVRAGVTKDMLGAPLLKKVCVDTEVEVAWKMEFENGLTFEQFVSHLSEICSGEVLPNPNVGSQCKACEFRIGSDLKQAGLLSGFETCWTQAQNLSPTDFEKPFSFDVWNFRKAGKLVAAGKYFMADIDETDVSPSSGAEPGLSSSERQWLQIQKIQSGDKTPFFDVDGLSREMKRWRYPLHFIDFETTMVALPFHKGRRPYEQIAFQFSHHQVNQDGKAVHSDEYINRNRGTFPNFESVRELKRALSKDDGTIFRYAAHENTVLCQIREQILQTTEHLDDAEELIAFIESITSSTENCVSEWTGRRQMVDMCELVKKYFYHPLTKGSNSIKKVLPAILSTSAELQARYSKPIYGTPELPSRNYQNWKWIELLQSGSIADPYKKLPPVFSDLDLATMESLITDGSIADGGAAMTAYARMQFTEMSKAESERVCAALLKYCELDTFAMVLIFEFWKHEISRAKDKEAA